MNFFGGRQLSWENNINEIENEREEIEIFSRISMAAHEDAKQKKLKIDDKIKELQEESSALENVMNSTLRKIKDKEDK